MKWTYNMAQFVAACDYIEKNNTRINWDSHRRPQEIIFDLMNVVVGGCWRSSSAGVTVVAWQDDDDSNILEILVDPNIGSDLYTWTEYKP